nr:uncharacterized protein LOC111413918 isoform X1 [Onthophagus taurus]XP_022910787.1 uncharacterized protein LOC111421824 isoform X1 [Onthophagus taurus]
MKHNFVIEIFILTIFLCVIQSNSDYDYYWRDYDGSIPPDAVSAAYGLYIGQKFQKCTLIPGSIYSQNQTFIGEYVGKFETKDDVKILCSSRVLKWVTVNMEKFFYEGNLIPSEYCKLVPGGYQDAGNYRWYIGRVFHENMWKVSKVDLRNFKALSVWSINGSYERVKNFEMLVVCKINL